MTPKLKTLPQNNLIAELADVFSQYPRSEKILIMPDYQTGRQILENLVRSGTPWINFRVKTVELLATELVKAALIEKGLERLSAVGMQLVIDSVFRNRGTHYLILSPLRIIKYCVPEMRARKCVRKVRKSSER